MAFHEDVRIQYDKKLDRQTQHTKYRIKVYTTIKEYAPISGHRFVSLVSLKDASRNPLAFILQSIGRAPFEENKWTRSGKKLEPMVLDLLKNEYPFENVNTYSFEDGVTSIDKQFTFIRDFTADMNGVPIVGEIKTYYKRDKLAVDSEGKPKIDLDWWLQLRLELDCLGDDQNTFGMLAYYYVEPKILDLLESGKTKEIEAFKNKGLSKEELNIAFMRPSDDLDRERELLTYFKPNYGVTTFKELKDLALQKRDELLTRYEDKGGTFYYCTKEHHRTMGFDVVGQLLEQASKIMKVEEVENIMEG
jgi:hypothetical protein